MKQKRRYVISLICIMLAFQLISGTVIYAESTITATAKSDRRNVTITGSMGSSEGGQPVTLRVGSAEQTLYIDQKNCNSTGNFQFQFTMPENLPNGEYDYYLGSRRNGKFSGSFSYYGDTPVQARKIMETDLDIVLSNYVPMVSGTISCFPGKEIEIYAKNITDNKVIKWISIQAEDGSYHFSTTLPSLISAKEYELSIVCKDSSGVLASTSVVIDSSIILVSIDGAVTTADGVYMDVRAKSTNTGLVDKSTTIRGTETVSETIPNLIANAAFEFSAVGYEEYRPGVEGVTCSVVGVAGDVVDVVAKGQNIASFEDRFFVLEYDASQLELVDLFGLSLESTQDVGQEGNVEIVSFSPGCIVFKIHNIDIPDGKVWSGVLNLFKFQFAPNHTGGSVLSIQ
ncbi:MAG: hypothetical protein IKW60_00740 [Clostridia bacterium]|nr:hypothetical protein [Clostridia bacterium]